MKKREGATAVETDVEDLQDKLVPFGADMSMRSNGYIVVNLLS